MSNKKFHAWSKEEDEQLIALVHKYGKKWTKIVAEMPDLNTQQLSVRWRKLSASPLARPPPARSPLAISPPARPPPGWTLRADSILHLLVQHHKGKTWSELAELFNSYVPEDERSDVVSMKKRWVAMNDCSIRRDFLTVEDAGLLGALRGEKSLGWLEIPRHLPHIRVDFLMEYWGIHHPVQLFDAD